MKRTMQKVLACLAAMILLMSVGTGALASSHHSSIFRLPPVLARPTPAPVEEAAPEEAPSDVTGPVARGEADIRQAADGLSEIVLTVPDGAALTVLAVEGDWAKVSVDGVTGYIYRDDARNIAFAEPEDEQAANMKVTIFSSRRSNMTPGEMVKLTSKLEGFDGYTVIYQWECDKGDGFKSVEGANDPTYTFEASVETLCYDWRLVVYYA